MSDEETKIRERLSSILVSIHFGGIEQKILYILADGQAHKRDEIIKEVGGKSWTSLRLSSHIKNIRIKLKPVNHGIVCEAHHLSYYYRYVILLSSLSK